MIDLHNRRSFLRAAVAAGAAWTVSDVTQIGEAVAWAAQQAGQAAPAWLILTPAQAAAIESMTARIVPAVDGRPGAREAGAVHFIDKALATFNAPMRRQYAAGARDLDQRARHLRAASFAALSGAQQDDILRAIESTPFFQAARFDTIVGTFALPEWGGNRDHAGWRLIGLEHAPRFQAPFGYYDADANARTRIAAFADGPPGGGARDREDA